MKKSILIIAVLLTTGIFSLVSAQVTPPGAGDKDLRDTNVKGRSNELERIDRQMKKDAAKNKNKSAAQTTGALAEDALAAKYGEIKTDYEQIQMSQDAVIKAYQGGAAIDYAQIGKSSAEINQSAQRLSMNLFPAPVAADNAAAKKVDETGLKKEEKVEREVRKPKSVRELIVELDNAVGSFATSPMFQNLRTVDAAVAEKTKSDLEKVIELSAMLDAEATKMAAGGK